jgi:hypothetical protein
LPGYLTGTTDRRILLLGAGAAVALLLIALIVSPGAPETSSVPSVYSSGPQGARAAYLLLKDLHYDVQIQEEPPNLLRAVPGALLIIADPAQLPTATETKALHHFVQDGGDVIFTGPAVVRFFPGTPVVPMYAGSDYTLSPALPGAISRGARQIVLRPRAEMRNPPSRYFPIYGNRDSALVVLWRIGKGHVIWWAAADPLTNHGIRNADNLQLLLNSVACCSSRTSIFWDEYFHGERVSLGAYLAKPPVLGGTAQILFAAALFIFSFSRRSGPLMPSSAVSRMSPLEFVDTMGALYRHAHGYPIPVEVAFRNFRIALARRVGVSSEASDAELASLAGVVLRADPSRIEDAFRRARAALESKPKRLSPAAALDTVRRMELLQHEIDASAQAVTRTAVVRDSKRRNSEP